MSAVDVIEEAIGFRQADCCFTCKHAAKGMVPYCHHDSMPKSKRYIYLTAICNLFERASGGTLKQRNERDSWDQEKSEPEPEPEPGCDCNPNDEFSYESCPVHTPKEYRRVRP